MMKTCKVCGKELPAAVQGIQTCQHCHTRYDLARKHIDNTDTMVSRMDCTHPHVTFLSGSNGFSMSGGEHHTHRHNVTLCRYCGEFRVFGNVNGERFDISFALVTDEDIQAAGRYLRLLKADELNA